MIRDLRGIVRPIFTFAKGLPIQVLVRVKKGSLIRFTNNGVHQNGFQDLTTYTLRVLAKGGPVYAESTDVSEAGIRESIRKIQILVPHPQPLPRMKPKGFLQRKEFFPFRLEKIPDMAAWAIEEGLRFIRQEQATANGYFSAYQRFFYLKNSGGLELFHPATSVRFGVTVRKGPAKGYFSFYHPDPRKLHVRQVIGKALALVGGTSQREVVLPPGEYECVFSPRALLELLEPLRRHFDRKLCEDRKSVFTGLLGKKIFSPAFTLYDSLSYPGQFGVPFDAEGFPRRGAALVKRGVLHDLLAEGHSSRGFSEHPFNPQNFVVEKGNFSLSEIFERIHRGIFINKIWYHTLVKESEMEVTGLGAGGSLYIEKGKVQGSVSHLRYHDSLFSIFRSVIGTTRERVLLKDGETGAALLPYLWVSRIRLV